MIARAGVANARNKMREKRDQGPRLQEKLDSTNLKLNELEHTKLRYF